MESADIINKIVDYIDDPQYFARLMQINKNWRRVFYKRTKYSAIKISSGNIKRFFEMIRKNLSWELQGEKFHVDKVILLSDNWWVKYYINDNIIINHLVINIANPETYDVYSVQGWSLTNGKKIGYVNDINFNTASLINYGKSQDYLKLSTVNKFIYLDVKDLFVHYYSDSYPHLKALILRDSYWPTLKFPNLELLSISCMTMTQTLSHILPSVKYLHLRFDDEIIPKQIVGGFSLLDNVKMYDLMSATTLKLVFIDKLRRDQCQIDKKSICDRFHYIVIHYDNSEITLGVTNNKIDVLFKGEFEHYYHKYLY